MDRRAKVELVEVFRDRYVASEKQAKSRILYELVQITGYHRKYALRLLRKNMPPPPYEAHVRRINWTCPRFARRESAELLLVEWCFMCSIAAWADSDCLVARRTTRRLRTLWRRHSKRFPCGSAAIV